MSGWIAMLTIRPRRLLLLGIILSGATGQAAEKQEPNTPSDDLLEFLAEWETRSGDWLGPEALEALPEVDENKATEKSDAK